MRAILAAMALAGAVLWCSPAIAVERSAIDKLFQVVDTLGIGAGLAFACSRSPAVETKDSLAWIRRMLTLEGLAMEYAERLAPGDEAAATATMLAMAAYSAELQEAPQYVWDDPQGCGEEMKREINDMIHAARCRLKSTTQRGLDLLLNPRECHP